MSDWELVPDNSQKQMSPPPGGSSDWEVAQVQSKSQQPQSPESFGTAAFKAPFRIGEDVLKGGMNFLKNIPQYFESAKTEVPGLLNVLQSNPMHAGGQALAGLTELGHGVLNFPHGLAEYGANRLNLIPKSVAEKIPYQKDISQDINQLFGEPKYPGAALIRGIPRNALNILGSGKLASAFNPVNLRVKNIAKDVLDARNAMMEKYSGPNGLYTKLFNKSRDMGLGNVKYDPQKININAIKEYANPKYYEALENFIKKPDIELAQKAQSDLNKYVNSMKNRSSIPSSEQASLKAAKEAQKHIKESMFNGNEKLQKQYKKISQGYGKEAIPYITNKAINDFLNKDILASELVSKLSKGKFAAKRGKFHGEIAIRNFLNNHPYLTGGAIGGIGTKLYSDAMGNKLPNE